MLNGSRIKNITFQIILIISPSAFVSFMISDVAAATLPYIKYSFRRKKTAFHDNRTQ